MARFESPIGNRQVTGNQLREFDIPDGEDDIPQFNVDQAIASGQLKKLDMDEIRQFQEKLNSINNEEDPRPQNRAQYSSPQYASNQDIRAVEEAHRNSRRGVERLSVGAKKRIEMLIGMTRTVRVINIDNTEYVLQTLKSQEMRDALLASAKFEHTVEFPFEIRLQFLSRSLVKLGGVDIEQFLGDNSFETKLLFINELDEFLLTRLYEEYTNLAKEASQKYSIKSTQEAEGVVDDLKK